MNNKMTNLKALNTVLSFNDDNDVFSDDVVERLTAMRDSLLKKSENRKPTKTQEQNEVFKAEILATLTDSGVTVSDLQSKSAILGGLSNQKVSALLRLMVDENTVVKTIDKKKSYFSLPLGE